MGKQITNETEVIRRVGLLARLSRPSPVPVQGQGSGSSPWYGNTSVGVAWTARTSHDSGAKPSDPSRYAGVRPSVIRLGGVAPRVVRTCSRHASGVGVAGSRGSPATIASRWVQARGTTSTRE